MAITRLEGVKRDGRQAYANRPRSRAVNGRVQATSCSWDEAARAIEHLVHHVGGDRRFASLTFDDLVEAIDARTNMRTGEPVADGTKERTVGVHKALWSDAVRRGWHGTNIATDLPSTTAGTSSGPTCRACASSRLLPPSWIAQRSP